MTARPTIIGIVGDSGAGKSTFAAGLVQALGPGRTVCLSADDYLRYSRKQRTQRDLTPYDPDCNFLDILEQHIGLLRNGQPILKPVYNHCGGELEPPEYVEPKAFIILEGLLGLATPQLRDACDVKLYMEPEEGLRLRWKFLRDTTWGGYSKEQLTGFLDRWKRDSEKTVLPQRAFVDMVICFYPPDDRPDEQGAGLHVRHILRPTLPYLDLAPLLEVGADSGFVLELARDIDRRPVDALQIFAPPDPGRAQAMQDYLWSLLPQETQTLPGLGEYRVDTDRFETSQTLALSQLLVAHYLLNAARPDDAE